MNDPLLEFVMPCHVRVISLLLFTLLSLGDAVAQGIFSNGFEGTSNRTTPLGNNLDGVTDFASSYNFVDVMKQSRTWITQDTQGGIFDTEDADCLDLDSNGYVQSMTPLSGCAAPNYNAVATLFFFGDLNGHYPSGRYVVTYEGQGTISYHFAATKNLALSTPGRDVLDVNAANGGWMMRIDAITAGDHPRNMHVWMPGFDETTGPAQRFHPNFLSLIAYEGGQHLVGIFGVENNNAITDLLTSANRDPRMGQAYANYLTQWKAQGGELFVHFTASGDYSKWGSWGAVEFLDEPNTAKQQTLLDFGLSHPCWWQGCAD